MSLDSREIVIPLTSGKETVVDAESMDLISGYKWWATLCAPDRWYAMTQLWINRKRVNLYMHRLIAGAVKGQMVDHIDRDSLRNLRSNLRITTQVRNQQNRAKTSLPKSSRFKGVQRNGRSIKWSSKITVNKVIIRLGSFASEVDAARAYDTAAIHHFGEFAMTNAMLGLYDDQEALPGHSQINKIPD